MGERGTQQFLKQTITNEKHFIDIPMHGGLWIISKQEQGGFVGNSSSSIIFRCSSWTFFVFVCFSNAKSHPLPNSHLVLDWTKPEKKLRLAKLQPSKRGLLKSRKLWQSWVAEKLLELIHCGHGDRQQPPSSDGKTQKHLQNRLEKYCWSLLFGWALAPRAALEAFRRSLAVGEAGMVYPWALTSLVLCLCTEMQRWKALKVKGMRRIGLVLAAFVTAAEAQQALNTRWWRAAFPTSSPGRAKSQTCARGLTNSFMGRKKTVLAVKPIKKKNPPGGQDIMEAHCSRRLFRSLIWTAMMRTGCIILTCGVGSKEMEGVR